MIYISRNYTEIGPFTNRELLDFLDRGVLREGDHFRAHGEDIWWSLGEWLEKAKTEGEVKEPSKAAPKAKKAVKKSARKAVAKKAAGKSAVKSGE